MEHQLQLQALEVTEDCLPASLKVDIWIQLLTPFIYWLKLLPRFNGNNTVILNCYLNWWSSACLSVGWVNVIFCLAVPCPPLLGCGWVSRAGTQRLDFDPARPLCWPHGTFFFEGAFHQPLRHTGTSDPLTTSTNTGAHKYTVCWHTRTFHCERWHPRLLI